MALRLQRELPQARLIGHEGCSHLVLLECRDRALPEALSFLSYDQSHRRPTHGTMNRWIGRWHVVMEARDMAAVAIGSLKG